MSCVTPLVVTHPCALVRDGLREILSKSTFRPTHILPALDEDTENLLASSGVCIWLVGVNECGTTTNDLVSRVVAKNPDVRAVILTGAHTASDILPAFVAGACGFLRQDIPSKQLIKSLELVALGQSVMHPHFRQMGLISPAGPAPALAKAMLRRRQTLGSSRAGQTCGLPPMACRQAASRATTWSGACRAANW